MSITGYLSSAGRAEKIRYFRKEFERDLAVAVQASLEHDTAAATGAAGGAGAYTGVTNERGGLDNIQQHPYQPQHQQQQQQQQQQQYTPYMEQQRRTTGGNGAAYGAGAGRGYPGQGPPPAQAYGGQPQRQTTGFNFDDVQQQQPPRHLQQRRPGAPGGPGGNGNGNGYRQNQFAYPEQRRTQPQMPNGGVV